MRFSGSCPMNKDGLDACDLDGPREYMCSVCLTLVVKAERPPDWSPRVKKEEKNQCDGCQAGIPVDESGYHRMGKGAYPDFMGCQATKYNKDKP